MQGLHQNIQDKGQLAQTYQGGSRLGGTLAAALITCTHLYDSWNKIHHYSSSFTSF
jgi:hypothetical protein